jgi:drug/metabolite transporter (DMT)-like permease
MPIAAIQGKRMSTAAAKSSQPSAVPDSGAGSGSSPGKDYTSGVILILLGTVAFSSAGLFVRYIGKDAATILFWRGLFTALAVTAYVVWKEGWGTWASFKAIGWPGLVVASMSAVSMGCFVASLQTTSVANNSIIFGTAPFITAAVAWLMIRERPSAPTILFSGVALFGAVLVMGSSFTLSGGALRGDALAVIMTVAFALKTVLVRKHRTVPMVPSGCIGALLGSLGAIPFVQEWSLSPSDLALFAAFGFTQQGAGLILTTIGVARIPAAHAALLMVFDLPLSPLWVWLAFGELPTRLGLIGGLVVLAAIVGHVVIEGRRHRAG